MSAFHKVLSGLFKSKIKGFKRFVFTRRHNTGDVYLKVYVENNDIPFVLLIKDKLADLEYKDYLNMAYAIQNKINEHERLSGASDDSPQATS